MSTVESLFTPPDSTKISGDVASPFTFHPSKPRAYLTFNWREAFSGKTEIHPLVSLLQSKGFEVYPWWDTRHGTAAKPVQAKWIMDFIGHPSCSLYLWDLSTRGNSENLDGSSKVIWHMCMGLGMRCLIYDTALVNEEDPTNDFYRPFAADVGYRKHPILNYLGGTVIGKRLPNDSISLLIDNEPLLEKSIDWVLSEGALPPPILLPSTTRSGCTPTPDKPAVYLTCDWKSTPESLQKTFKDTFDLFPWWDANTHRGAPHAIQTARIVSYFMRPEFHAFVSDLTSYVDSEGKTRCDGSGKFMWQFLVGRSLWMVHRENPRRLAEGEVPLTLPRLIFLDGEKASRKPVLGTDVPMHPAMAFICANTVNRPIGEIVTNYVETPEEVSTLL